MNPLHAFYNDKGMMNAVRSLFIESLRELALEELMRNEDARYISKSITAIERGFDLLETEFGKKKPPQETNSAR